MRQRYRATALAALALSLAACGSERDDPADVPTPTEPSAAMPSESIIRPEVVASPIIDLPPSPLATTVVFPEGGAALNKVALNQLEKVMASEQVAEGWPVILRGHSDSSGDDADNLAVARRRAQAVARYLADHGLPADRITVISLGEQRPIAPNANLDGTPNEAGRAKNRRVDIEVAPPAEAAQSVENAP